MVMPRLRSRKFYLPQMKTVSAPAISSFRGSIDTPRNSCVRFVFGVAAASRNTRFQAACYGLTWARLAPADRASFAWRLPSFDHLVGAQQKGFRDREAKRLRGLEVDDQFEFRRPFDRQVARVRPFENFVHEAAEPPVEVGQARRIGDQAAGNGELPVAVDGGQPRAQRHRGDLRAAGKEKRVLADVKALHAFARGDRECG